MKIKITERGAHGPATKEFPNGFPFKAGKVYNLGSMTEIPAYLVGKCVVVGAEPEAEGDTAGKTAVTNPALSEAELARQARLVELASGLSKEDLTKDGVPKVEAINELLDKGEEMFTADERNKLWQA